MVVLGGQNQLSAGVPVLDWLIHWCGCEIETVAPSGGAEMELVAGSAQLSASLSSTHTHGLQANQPWLTKMSARPSASVDRWLQ